MKVDLDYQQFRASEATHDPFARDEWERDNLVHQPQYHLALIAHIRALYDAAYSALSLTAASVSARDSEWYAERGRIETLVDGAVVQLGDSVVEKEDMQQRVAKLRATYGARPAWWRPFARRRWDRWMAGVEQRVLERMREELEAADRAEVPVYCAGSPCPKCNLIWTHTHRVP